MSFEKMDPWYGLMDDRNKVSKTLGGVRPPGTLRGGRQRVAGMAETTRLSWHVIPGSWALKKPDYAR